MEAVIDPVTSARSTELTLAEQTRNVVLFGECGVGKSSIINAILGQPLAKTSNDVQGCTYETTSYTAILDSGIKINLWDTIGLDEGTAGRVPADLAKQRLKSFLQAQIMTSDGVDLLLFCIRGASGKKGLPMKRGHWENYKFVFDDVCNRKIPVAMIVTHLESYDPNGDMETWWTHNEQRISEFGFQTCAHACITILTPESLNADGEDDRFKISRRKLHNLLSHSFLAPRNVLLIGDCEDRDEFINTVTPLRLRNKQHTDDKGIPPSFTSVQVAFEEHTHVNFWNTNAFDDPNDDVLVTEKNLKLFVRGMRQIPGVDLLVFCFRAGRPKIRHVRKFHLFHAAICRKKVPMAIVVFGPEDGADMWWQRNEQDLRRKGFLFDRHVYILRDPCQPSADLDDGGRHQLIDLVQEEHTSGSWNIGDDAFWVTVPNVRAVMGELAWPTTTIVICDTTKQGAFSCIASSVQSSLQHAVGPHREHRFRQVDPQSLSLPQSRTGLELNKGIGLVVSFVPMGDPDVETWRTLERFYTIYKGNITPLILVVYGACDRKAAEDFWRAAPRHIRRCIGGNLTHHPGPNASADAQAVAQEIMVDMIQHQCLVDLGERVGILREILSIWKKYRSQRNGQNVR